MGSVIKCFVLEPSDFAEVSFRRFTYNPGCTESWGHDASVTIGREAYPRSNDQQGDALSEPDKSDPRWPTKCTKCGYVFQIDDQWQVFRNRLFTRSDNGELTTIVSAPPGAMWYADWLQNLARYQRSPDGRVLVVKTPGGDWAVDGPSRDGSGWNRTGVPPNVTVTPSIIIGNYHGFLTDGELREC